MKNKKSIILSTITILLLNFTFTGCGRQITAEESANILLNVIMQSDISSTDKLDMKTYEGKKLLNFCEEYEMHQIIESFPKMGLLATEKEYESIYNELIKAQGKNKYKIEQISKSKDEAQIKITTTYIDDSKLKEKAFEDSKKQVDDIQFSDDSDIITKQSMLYVDNIVDEYKNAEVSSDTKEKVFTFYKQNGCWIPSNEEEFLLEIAKLIKNEE